MTILVCECSHLWDGKKCTFCGRRGKQHKYQAIPQRVCSQCSFVWAACGGLECPECKSLDSRYFASKRELERYGELRLMEKSGLIEDLKIQQRYPLRINGRTVCSYVADFTYRSEGRRVVEDVKSKATRTASYRLKRELMLAVHGIEISEVN